MTKITLANAGEMKKKPHDVLKRIKYKSGQKGERYIDRGQETVTLEHLDDAGYMTLIASHVVKPAKQAGGKS